MFDSSVQGQITESIELKKMARILKRKFMIIPDICTGSILSIKQKKTMS